MARVTLQLVEATDDLEVPEMFALELNPGALDAIKEARVLVNSEHNEICAIQLKTDKLFAYKKKEPIDIGGIGTNYITVYPLDTYWNVFNKYDSGIKAEYIIRI